MLLASFDNVKLISKKQPNLESMILRKGWTLISRSGTIGNVAYVRKDMDGLAGSEHIMRVVPSPQAILPGYLYAFVSSDLGKSLIKSGTFGAVVDTIAPDFVAGLPIPRLDPATEQRIHELIERAATLWSSAQAELTKAQVPFSYLLTDEVQSYFPHNTDFVVVKLSELQDRLGAHYHSSTYRRLESTIRSEEHKELGELSLRIFAPSLFKHIYLSQPNRYPFITGGQLTNRRFTNVRYLSPYGMRDINDYVVHEGWLTIYKSGQLDSMLGTAFYISKQLEGFCLSDHVIRVVIDEERISPAYVFAFLSTWAGRLLVIRQAMGKSVPFVREETVSTIPIPILAQGTQLQVAKLVKHAFAMRVESLELEDQAQALLSEALGLSKITQTEAQ